VRALRRVGVLQDSMPLSARSDEWREDRAAVLHSLALAAISAGDDTAAEVIEPVSLHNFNMLQVEPTVVKLVVQAMCASV
jgi:hypothetical protein